MTDGLYLTELQNQYLEAEIIEICQRQKPITVRGVYYACVLSRALPFLTKDSDGAAVPDRCCPSVGCRAAGRDDGAARTARPLGARPGD